MGLNVGMFGTVFGQSRIVLRIGFGPATDVFGVHCLFWCLGLFLAQDGNGKVDLTRTGSGKCRDCMMLCFGVIACVKTNHVDICLFDVLT